MDPVPVGIAGAYEQHKVVGLWGLPKDCDRVGLFQTRQEHEVGVLSEFIRDVVGHVLGRCGVHLANEQASEPKSLTAMRNARLTIKVEVPAQDEQLIPELELIRRDACANE